jgi:hypothetical protein
MDGANPANGSTGANLLESLQFLLTPQSPSGLPRHPNDRGGEKSLSYFLPLLDLGTSRNCNSSIIFGFASRVNLKRRFQSYGMTGRTKWVHREFHPSFRLILGCLRG